MVSKEGDRSGTEFHGQNERLFSQFKTSFDEVAAIVNNPSLVTIHSKTRRFGPHTFDILQDGLFENADSGAIRKEDETGEITDISIGEKIRSYFRNEDTGLLKTSHFGQTVELDDKSESLYVTLVGPHPRARIDNVFNKLPKNEKGKFFRKPNIFPPYGMISTSAKYNLDGKIQGVEITFIQDNRYRAGYMGQDRILYAVKNDKVELEYAYCLEQIGLSRKKFGSDVENLLRSSVGIQTHHTNANAIKRLDEIGVMFPNIDGASLDTKGIELPIGLRSSKGDVFSFNSRFPTSIDLAKALEDIKRNRPLFPALSEAA